MHRIWSIFLNWLERKMTPQQAVRLKPGTCECTHGRCGHKDGKYACNVKWNHEGRLVRCACLLFILDDDDDNGGQPNTPSPAELERMYGGV